MLNQDFEIIPAYGRDYKSKKAAMADWDANKDFKIRATGQYVSKSSVERYGTNGCTVYLRYNNLRHVFPLGSW